jgi:hypothetical protein
MPGFGHCFLRFLLCFGIAFSAFGALEILRFARISNQIGIEHAGRCANDTSSGHGDCWK